MKHPVRTIVVGVGLVEELGHVLPTALRLAERVQARLHVVHVLNLPEVTRGGGATDSRLAPSSYVAAQVESVEAALRAQCARLTGSLELLTFHVRTGSPHQQLISVAAEVSADLLVVGATRRGRLWRSLLGTTAERVLREARVPVLVLHEPFFASVRRVLLSTDLSTLSTRIHERGLDAVEGLFGAEGLDCRSVYVLDYTFPAAALDGNESMEELGVAEMNTFVRELGPRSYPIEGRVRIGEPAMEINVEADAWSADLIVLGTHGRRGLSRFVLGSVAASTIRDAARNVLVIPGNCQDSEQDDVASLDPVAAPDSEALAG